MGQKLRSFDKNGPAIVAVGILSLVCLIHGLSRWVPGFKAVQQVEWMTYDWRVREASRHEPLIATNLGFVFIDDESLKALIDGSFPFRHGLYWPRHVYGRVVRELSHQGAKAVAFDVLFGELRPDHPRVRLPDKTLVGSDEFLAAQMQLASNVILAASSGVVPPDMLRTNALGIGDISAEGDQDSILRRVRAYTTYGDTRVWHMGIVLAAAELGLDLDHAVVEPEQGRIRLRGVNGVERIIPTDRDGYFYIDWSLTYQDGRLTKERFEGLLENDLLREAGEGAALSNRWHGKLVVIGSTATGNDLTDLGATPLESKTFLISKHWNVANSVITGRFIESTRTTTDLLVIILLGAIAAVLTWNFRAPWPTLGVIIIGAAYGYIALQLYISFRLWVPIFMPVFGGLGLTHLGIVTYQVFFEQNEKRHVRSVFSRLVSPNVVHELLKAEKLNLGGARRQVTVFFADVRGFTEMTDTAQARAEEFVRTHKLSPEQAEVHFDEQARETLKTVNVYLASIADQIKKHGGTLDKYIGDCVMAFWGAPTPNERHALDCVRAAIEAQRTLYELNQQRFAENKKREAENLTRVAAGQPPLALLPLLSLGTGINTGTAIVGLMGSADHILNYTVFGREVNLASRLEGVSGRGRIIIGEATYHDLLRDDPALAGTCVEQPPTTPKGFNKPVRIFEVPWKASSHPETDLKRKFEFSTLPPFKTT